MASVLIETIRKNYGATSVLRDVSLSVADGEFLTLLGPLGCGKSTLLRIVAGLEVKDAGSISIGERAVIGRPSASWLRDEDTAVPVLTRIGICQNLDYAIVFFLAGLKRIPQDLYDAADVDGADLWLDRLRTVILPMLRPVSMFVVIVVALRAIESFDTLKVLTLGGPSHAFEVLPKRSRTALANAPWRSSDQIAISPTSDHSSTDRAHLRPLYPDSGGWCRTIQFVGKFS